MQCAGFCIMTANLSVNELPPQEVPAPWRSPPGQPRRQACLNGPGSACAKLSGDGKRAVRFEF